MKLELAGAHVEMGAFPLVAEACVEARVVGVFGPSGAGKTTLLEAIAGLRRLGAGAIRLDGETLADAAADVHVPSRDRRLGYVPQDGALFPHLDVAGNLRYARRAPPGGELELEVLRVLELEPLLAAPVRDLSGGERRRVALGRALLARPRLLLLDEPLTGLDWRLKDQVAGYLAAVRDTLPVPIVYVSHDPQEVLALCEQVLVLERGRVVACGAAAPLMRRVASTAPGGRDIVSSA